MTTRFAWLCFVLLLSSVAYAVESTEEYNEYTIGPEDIPLDAPKFEGFPASPYTGPNAKPDLHGNRESRTFRTQLVSWAKEKPNFAGHYILGT